MTYSCPWSRLPLLRYGRSFGNGGIPWTVLGAWYSTLSVSLGCKLIVGGRSINLSLLMINPNSLTAISLIIAIAADSSPFNRFKNMLSRESGLVGSWLVVSSPILLRAKIWAASSVWSAIASWIWSRRRSWARASLFGEQLTHHGRRWACRQ